MRDKAETAQECKGREEGDREVQEEGRRPKIKINPVLPSKAEVDEHGRTHIPFRSWCPFCIIGRARNDAHKAGSAKN